MRTPEDCVGKGFKRLRIYAQEVETKLHYIYIQIVNTETLVYD